MASGFKEREAARKMNVQKSESLISKMGDPSAALKKQKAQIEKLEKKIEETESKRAQQKERAKEQRRKKYSISIEFDPELEETIKGRAKDQGIGVATYIKGLVSADLKKAKRNGNK